MPIPRVGTDGHTVGRAFASALGLSSEPARRRSVTPAFYVRSARAFTRRNEVDKSKPALAGSPIPQPSPASSWA